MLLFLLACLPELPVEAPLDQDPLVLCEGFEDADGDGYGGAPLEVDCEALPDSWVEVGGDCDDADAETFPGAEVTCESGDRNCDGIDDDLDADGDGFAGCEECDDTDAATFPGADELCDAVDNDCDEAIDEEPTDGTTFYVDADADGFGGTEPFVACELTEGLSETDDDCDDALDSVFPGADEVCDEVDQDCDETIDEAPIDGDLWYSDSDLDGFGDPASETVACEAPEGWLDVAEDCAPEDATVNPDAAEVCDGVDNDCDGTTDPDESEDAPTWYFDSDTDGFGDAAVSAISCEAPSGYLADDTDCDDSDAGVYPGAPETCDDADQDCDTTVDESATDADTWYADTDSDGYGDPADSQTLCDQPSGYVADDTDCGPTDTNTYPGADETCDDADQDCDSVVDEDAIDPDTWYADGDGDGHGDSDGGATTACDEPSGYAASDDDCDDSDASVSPSASEACNGVDDDCDSSTDESFNDTDSDGTADCVDACPVYADPTVSASGDGSETSPYDSIATAISLRGDYCDDILLEAGTYYETVDYGGDDLTIVSVSGAASTIIDASTTGGAVVVFENGESSAALLEGVTLTGGTGQPGDGTSMASPISDTLDSSTSHGGGLYINGADPTITDCIIEDNVVDGYGGGVFAYDFDGEISDTIIEGNESSAYDVSGGGVWLGNSSGTLSGVSFLDNDASGGSGDGGGLLVWGGSPEIVSSWFEGNTATHTGDGARYYYAGGLFANNIVLGEDEGLTIRGSSSVDVINNTFYDVGTAIWLWNEYWDFPTGDLVNNLFNYDDYGLYFSYSTMCSSLGSVSYNNFRGGNRSSRSYNCSSYVAPSSTTNTAEKEGFTDAGKDDFTLKSSSAVKDAGTDTSGYGVTTDYAGTSRSSGSYSQGAYEK